LLQLQEEYERELGKKAARRPKRRKQTRKSSTFWCESEPILSKSEVKEETTTELVHIPETRTETPISLAKPRTLSPPAQLLPVPKPKPAPIRVPSPKASPPPLKKSPSPIPEQPKRSLSPKFPYRRKENFPIKAVQPIHKKSVSESIPLSLSPPRPILKLKGRFPPPTMQRVAKGGEVFSVHVLGESPQYCAGVEGRGRHHSMDVETYRRPLRSETSLAHSTKGSESYRSPGLRESRGKRLETTYQRTGWMEERPAFHVFRDLSFDQ